MNVKKIALLVGALAIAVITAVMAKNMFAGAGAQQANAAPAVPVGPKVPIRGDNSFSIVKIDRWAAVGPCPLCPQKRTFVCAGGMSAKCHKRTWPIRDESRYKELDLG